MVIVLISTGPPVMSEIERYGAVASCKWVDEVVECAPYTTQLDVLEQYNIDFCVHGEDVSTDEFGNDTYALVKQANKYREIKRSEGVSTTELVGRMILCTKSHLNDALALDFHNMHNGTRSPTKFNRVLNNNDNDSNNKIDVNNTQLLTDDEKQQLTTTINSATSNDIPSSVYNNMSHFLPSTKLISTFSYNAHSIDHPNTIVYIDGAFDLFHIGHIESLKYAKSLGDYLIVGVHSDAVVNAIKGSNLPILNLQERALSVLSCRYVDEVVFAAPWSPTIQQLQQLRITIFAHGTCSDYPDDVPDPYLAAKQLGILKYFNSKYPGMTTSTIIQRIIDNRSVYAERQRKKAKGLQSILQQQQDDYNKRAQHNTSSNTT